jgi:asparagine synthase (glutamine-hydrolysing)
MCGIAGAINFQLDIPLLTKDLFHRGPDEQKTFTDDNLTLAHHRLSILDISGGAQPMHYKHFTIILMAKFIIIWRLEKTKLKLSYPF